MTPELLKQIEQEEGRIRWAYRDSLGYLTIGVGFLIDQKGGGGLQDIEIDFILHNRVQQAQDKVLQRWPWVAGQLPARRDALVNMAYQMGVNGLTAFEKFLAYLKDENYLLASDEMLDSKWAKQTPARAKRMSKQILTGEYQWTSQQ